MKKIVFVVLVGLLIGTAAFADHPDGIGIGGICGNGYGSLGYDLYPGLSLKVGPLPLFWGFYGHVSPAIGGFAMGVSGDYYLFDKWNLVDKITTDEDGEYHLKIDWYLGVGFFGNMHFWGDNYSTFDAGVRVPFGVSWHAMETLEVTLGTAPGFGVHNTYSDTLRFHYVIPVEIACRYWFINNTENKN